MEPALTDKTHPKINNWIQNSPITGLKTHLQSQSAAGGPWQHYDLGHGLCSYTFFEQCQHRMACAKCDFYIPKNSSKAQLLEAKANLQRMLVAIPLTDDERAAVDDGQAALDKLLERLADVPTPAGPTPRQLAIPAKATRLPIADVTRPGSRP